MMQSIRWQWMNSYMRSKHGQSIIIFTAINALCKLSIRKLSIDKNLHQEKQLFLLFFLNLKWKISDLPELKDSRNLSFLLCIFFSFPNVPFIEMKSIIYVYPSWRDKHTIKIHIDWREINRYSMCISSNSAAFNRYINASVNNQHWPNIIF